MNDDTLRDSLLELYEQAPAGYVFTDHAGALLRVNATFCAQTGYTRDELMEPPRRFQDLLTVAGRIFWENQYAPLLHLQGGVREVAFDLVQANGGRLPVLVNSVHRPAADGRPGLIASTVFDATDRRAYERELLRARQRAEQLAAIVTHSSEAILTATPDLTIQTWNRSAEQLFASAFADEPSRRLARYLPPLAEPVEAARLVRELAAGRAVSFETEGQDAAGATIEVAVSLTPHPGPLGDPAVVSAIVRDISERRAVARLQQEFLAMASHELRTPLAVIAGHAQLMRRRAAYRPDAIDAILGQSDRLERLIEDLLLASQIEARRLALTLVEVDLRTEVRAAVENARVSGRSLDIDLPTTPAPLLVLADPLRLGQVFANLLTNAVKYSPEGTGIDVRVWRDGAEARVAIADRGVGIAPDLLPRLFDRFYRTPGAVRQAQGLGLGLYITREIISGHGGRISVESTPGVGSTFTVTLPLANPGADADQTATPASSQ